MFEVNPILALHDEDVYFDYVRSIRNGLDAAKLLLASLDSVQSFQIYAEDTEDWMLESAARVVIRLRNEIRYRRAIAAYAEEMDAVRTLFGEETFIRVMEMSAKIRQGFVRPDIDELVRNYDNRGVLEERLRRTPALSSLNVFLDVLHGTPDCIEALDLCGRAKQAILCIELEALESDDKDLRLLCKDALTRINVEQNIISLVRKVAGIFPCVVQLEGEQGRVRFMEWMRRTSEHSEIHRINRLARRDRLARLEALAKDGRYKFLT